MILRKTEGRYSEVLPLWQDRTAVIFAGGVSLTKAQVQRVQEAFLSNEVGVIAINDAYLWAPWAHVNYFGDSQWWEWQTKGVAKPLIGFTTEEVRNAFANFAGQKCSVEHSGDRITDHAVHILRNMHYPRLDYGLSLDPTKVVTGKNSGFAALNIAVLSGAKRVILLGYDAHPNGPHRHWFGEHPRPAGNEVYEAMRRSFSVAEQAILDTGVKVINCSPGSALDNFPKMHLEEVL